MTDTSNSASTTIDLNQLKIKSSALKTSFPRIFGILCLIGIGGGSLIQLLSQQKDKPLNASQIKYSKKWQQTTKNQPNSKAKRIETIKTESKSKPVEKQETKKSLQSVEPTKQEKEPNTSNLAAETIASNQNISSVNLYPITNKICSQNEVLCIYNLADLIRKNRSQAYYTLSRTSRKAGQINARGTIQSYGSNTQVSNQTFTFQWKDNLQSTTNGYGAEGFFTLKKSVGDNRQGVLTNFKITNKYGNERSKWREKSIYLFPR